MQARQSSKSEEHAEQARFASLVAPLERAARRDLGEPSRGLCHAAFVANPGGFADICAAAVSRAKSNPVGLLVRMVRDGDHLRRERHADVVEIRPGVLAAARQPSDAAQLLDEDCMNCGGRPSLDDGSRILCTSCTDAAR